MDRLMNKVSLLSIILTVALGAKASAGQYDLDPSAVVLAGVASNEMHKIFDDSRKPCSTNLDQSFASSEIETRINSLVGKRSSIDGPNCFGTTLYGLGVTGGPIFSTKEELEPFLGLAGCTLIKDKPRLGDIGIVRNKSDPLSFGHSVLYLDPTRIFEKENPESSKTYEISNLNDLCNRYSIEGL
jgi:hypothetical protein